MSEGLRRAEDCSSLLLKWVPWRFRVRNCWNFAVVEGGGERGGDGGMSRLGMEGRVRSWMRARLEEYGDEGVDGDSGRVWRLDSEGSDGPRAGPIVGWGCG